MLKIFTVHILFRYKIILEIGNSFEKTILLDILLNIRVYTYYATSKTCKTYHGYLHYCVYNLPV